MPRGRLLRIALVVLGAWLVLGLLAVWAFSSGGEKPGFGRPHVVTVTTS